MSQRIRESLQVIDANLEFGRDLNLIISSIQLEGTRRRQERRANQRGRPLAVSSCGILSAKCSYPGDSARG
ncbi:hypothetical protein ALC60_08061 [Trachymyrmex zeteki]|uniref:Uncharacterized protein n=1 Tax=Mycetomoellerius zeteki TaxID=64791 RepID=A0A151WY08_9HYME|nr:hypothetical protein ALC60_08061 [Trachymyrmex zeteki]